MADLSQLYRSVLRRRLARYAFGGEAGADDEGLEKPKPTADEMLRSVKPPERGVDYSGPSPEEPPNATLEAVRKVKSRYDTIPLSLRFKKGGAMVIGRGKF